MTMASRHDSMCFMRHLGNKCQTSALVKCGRRKVLQHEDSYGFQCCMSRLLVYELVLWMELNNGGRGVKAHVLARHYVGRQRLDTRALRGWWA